MKNGFIRIIAAVLCTVMMAAAVIGVNADTGMAGDVNRDGGVDNKDVVVLFRYVSTNTDPGVDKNACDTTGDGQIDNKDVVLLFRHVSDPNVKIYYGAGQASESSDTDVTPDIQTDAETKEPTVTDTAAEEPTVTDEVTEEVITDDNYKTEIELQDYNFLSEEKEVRYDIAGSNGEFGLYNGAVQNGDTVTLKSGDHYGVYPTVSMPEDKTTTYVFYLKSDSAKTTATWCTFYLGLRLQSEQMNASSASGVWIAMRNTQIGLLTKTWPTTQYVDSPCDFSNEILVTVVDDPVENVIRIYTGEDKTETATVKIDGKNIVLSTAAGADTVSVTMSNEIIKGGFAHLWAHYPDNDVTVRGLYVTTVAETGVEDNNGIKNNSRDIFSDTWVAYDDNGREIVSSTTKPNGAKVGMFYFLWHEEMNNSGTLYDHTASYLKGGLDGLWTTMQSGPLGFAHYWAEPYFGYYCSNDEWVIRKHGAMLSEAGVDFIFFDATNGLLYPTNYEAVLRVWAKMRAEGFKTPDVCFLMREGDTAELSQLWANLYKVNMYEDLWFKWNGKPVIMFTGSNNTLTAEQKNFFTVKISWANEKDRWYTQKSGIDCWAWGTMYPQKGGYTMTNGKYKLEQMVVMSGFWVNGSYGTNAGRSYTSKTGEPKTSSGWDMGYALYPETSGKGLAYQEQFDYALKKNPKLIMITGWNEWWAGRWEGGGATGQTIAYEYTVSSDSSKKEYNYYVDNLNPEYSRDIEPMNGGFKDNYYYQTVKNIRDYKGTRHAESAFGQKTVDINGALSQWLSVGPEYRDVYGDTAHRRHKSHVGKKAYINNTGRNDIVTAKVSGDDEYLYFYAECADDITKPEGTNWMNLFIKTDENNENGWYGFDYIINRERTGNKASVMRFKDGWSTEKAGDAEYSFSGCVIVIKIKKSLIGFNGTSLDFKWADNSVDDGDIMKFLDKGDAAPDGRFCYRYTTQKSEPYIPDCLDSDMAVFKANGYNAYINGKQVRLVENNTKAVLLASGYNYYLPVSVLEELGVDCAGEKVYEHYGVSYVKANEPVQRSGKKVTITPDGLLIIANAKVTDTTVLDTLYRSLY